MFQLAVTPAGSPTGAPIPVDPVVAKVMGVNGELIQSVGSAEAGPRVLAAVTWIVPVAEIVPHPPVSGIV